VFPLLASFFELAQSRGLNPPLDPQAAKLSIEGRAVPDYGAPFNFFAQCERAATPGGAAIVPAFFQI
jgi:hypothetical protein